MLWTLWFGLLAALLSRTVTAQANAIYRDPDTGLVFSSNYVLYRVNQGITYRVAIPANVQTYTSYDAVIQAVIPNDVGWAGIAWAGSMPRNPLTVAWRNSQNQPVLSSRWAGPTTTPSTPFSGPAPSPTAPTWQYTALCKGCTSWTTDTGASRFLSPRGGNRMAFAYSPNRPSSPNSPTSTIPIHDVHGYWQHDFSGAANQDFDAIVERLASGV
ncbi:uncharacterized protein PODANS_1_21380 [Podospora anserina S mat+]|uniref:Podospora anserina S mat+ genomic DNA chromosome 1, supercontig 6 n=1 Tax=Podospora anserina (strain S / ATCC MYA-4624 / DSM 980 / FGSC 10383) TaxID=515849 RepID=B2ARU7_PODAN|nr:uncharacterized protein PODANS_1_21380 [Podospora anserina S mat+]CAP67117.1 unnamed protein product [Podospora anserina S mat+]